MVMLTGQYCLALVAQALLVDYICVERCLSTVVTIANLCDSVVTRLRTGKSARSPSFEELLRTLYHRAQCGHLYHRVLVFYNAPTCFKTLNTSLFKYSDVI
jgi:hypothetical protein